MLKAILWFGLFTSSVALAACGGGPQYGRIGTPVTLPNGPPRNACERKEWYELAPTRVRATGATNSVLYTTYYSQDQVGLAVFEFGEDDPEELEDVWPKMRRRKLQRRHEARLEPVDDANRRTLHWALGGLAVLGVGVGTAAAVQEKSPEVATAAGVTGLVGGIVGIVGALASQPSGEDQVYADGRRKLLVEGEDDLVSAAHGVNNANGSRRRKCGGKPVPFPRRAPTQPKPNPAPAAPVAAPANEPVTPAAAPPTAPPETAPADSPAPDSAPPVAPVPSP